MVKSRLKANTQVERVFSSLSQVKRPPVFLSVFSLNNLLFITSVLDVLVKVTHHNTLGSLQEI